MMNHDDDPSFASNSPQAMVGMPHPGAALAMQPIGAPMGASAVRAPSSPAQDVLRGGMDASWFLNSLRRRWMLALGMGLVVGTLAAIALWILVPPSASATALFQVSSETPSLAFEVNTNETRKFEILQKTQLALLKSRFVLQTAVRDPAIASLGILAGERDKVEWLMENLAIRFPQESEILSISLSGKREEAEDIRLLVDSVAKAYDKEVLYKEKQRKLNNRDQLAKSLRKLKGEINQKMEVYHDLAIESGTSAAYETDSQSQLLFREISDMMKQKGTLEAEALSLQTHFALMTEQLKDPAMMEAQIDAALEADPQIGMLRQEQMQVQYELNMNQGLMKRGNSKQIKRLSNKLAGLNQQIAQYRAQMKQQMMTQQKSAPNVALQQLNKSYQIQAGFLGQRLGTLTKSIEEKTESLHLRAEKSVELLTLNTELEQLHMIAGDMGIKLESLFIEDGAPARIQLIQNALPERGLNQIQHIAISGMGGLALFALTCLGVTYMEFRNRRLNDPEQVDEGLGIRVIGTLPALSAQKMLDPDHPIVAQLTESVDNVRTLLMHDSTSKPRRVVLVTSAVTMEGRTTVASQLAASLARAGRRTLLIDTDLRHPALHALFDAPLEDGLCEVLRAEVDVADAIRPTHSESLWLLTAGYCDVDAIHALATEQLQPVFDKLRAEYDFIILDGAPVLGMSDALLFGQYADGAILSVRRDFSQMPKIHQAAGMLSDVGIRLIGSVVNGMPTKSDSRVTQLRLTASKAERELQPS